MLEAYQLEQGEHGPFLDEEIFCQGIVDVCRHGGLGA